MRSEKNGSMQKDKKLNHLQGEGPNWILIAGGVLLSTLSFRVGCKLKQTFDSKRQINAVKGDGKRTARRRPGACQLHSDLHCFTPDENSCYYCISGIAGGRVDAKQATIGQVPKEADPSLPLVKVPASGTNREDGGVMWTSSPDRLEQPRKPPHYYSNSSGSPCFSDSGSDIYTKREVIQKLRKQLKRRDEMIIDMQTQITDLRNSLSIQVTQSANLQSQLDSANRDLFDSEREIQHLRKIIVESSAIRNWHPEATDGQVNGYPPDNVDDLDLHCIGVQKRGGGERVEMMKSQVRELKEVIEGKDFLLQSYKEQKLELCAKIKELQQQLSLASQVPDIL